MYSMHLSNLLLLADDYPCRLHGVEEVNLEQNLLVILFAVQ